MTAYDFLLHIYWIILYHLSGYHLIEERNTDLIHLTQHGTSIEIVKFKGVLKDGLTKIRHTYSETVVIVSGRTILQY